MARPTNGSILSHAKFKKAFWRARLAQKQKKKYFCMIFQLPITLIQVAKFTQAPDKRRARNKRREFLRFMWADVGMYYCVTFILPPDSASQLFSALVDFNSSSLPARLGLNYRGAPPPPQKKTKKKKKEKQQLKHFS